MINEQAPLNRIWSEAILEELYRFGVRHLCIAPGSRSTPLTLEAARHRGLTLHTHFDERGLGFLALGLAKSTHAPVAIIVTSGTAVANLLPAIAEANLTGERLVVLSADRPIDLIDCGANQAIIQQDIFSHHVTAALNLPSPATSISIGWLLSSMDELMSKQSANGGPVHINCAFPEPLYGGEMTDGLRQYRASISGWRDSNKPYSQPAWLAHSAVITQSDQNMLINELEQRKGVVIIGDVSLEEAEWGVRFAKKMGWPVLLDPQSGLSSSWAHYDLWLQYQSCIEALSECDLVLQFGGRIISKRLNQWIAMHQSHINHPSLYWLVSASLRRDNQHHLSQIHFPITCTQWYQQTEQVKPMTQGWAKGLDDKLINVRHALNSIMLDARLSEISLACHLGHLISLVDGNVNLFLGNSLFVRLVDMFSRLTSVSVYSNRGASGIDGLLASANGVARGADKPLLVVLGDTSALHDLNSLALYQNAKHPVVIVIINNDGGAIFDLLPVPAQQKRDLYQMPHGLGFEFAARQFNLGYLKPKTMNEYLRKVSHHLRHGKGVLVVEINVPNGEAASEIKQTHQVLHAVLS